MIRKFSFISFLLLLVACGGHTVYFGTYSGEVLSARFSDGKFSELSSVATIDNPSYLAIDGEDLYAVSETDSLPALDLIGKTSSPTLSAGPCHVSVGQGYAAVSNYSGGSLSVFRLPLDGKGPAFSFSGSIGGPDSVRQCTPHVHCAVFSPDGTRLVFSDFSADRLVSLAVSSDTMVVDRFYDLPSDTGPRHILFGSDSIVYVIGELSGDIDVLSFPDGRIIQTVEADPAHTRASADIRISPDGRHLYASNRLGMDGVAVFDILPGGTLHNVDYIATALCPRNIAVSPEGDYLIVASQTDDVVEVYPLDSVTGLPDPMYSSFSIAKPVCILFAD